MRARNAAGLGQAVLALCMGFHACLELLKSVSTSMRAVGPCMRV
eukprot:CAMPEP_0184388590 /NCGR_PEP_ID=MMETSP0007-20130409/11758_1 /TAXON_ID=97485 /ORGANISM="Prymnesium parvum, Strain Texoma1" /LENGTH=43 /DNA_ID= /DNA_START= /DNA_END= /DNA_ORIENTATION=